jgi:hypothetical protein
MEMENSPFLIEHRWHIRCRSHVLIFLLFFTFPGGATTHDAGKTQESIPRGSKEPTASVALTSDPLTRILNLKRNRASFHIDIWTDKKRYRIGETIRFYFRSDRDCYLTLILYEASGDTRVLFPNRVYQNNLIKAGKTYSIFSPESGFELTVQPPTGIEKVKAIATIEPFSLFDFEFTNNFFPEINRTNTRDMRSINSALNRLPHYDWTENICTISVR